MTGIVSLVEALDFMISIGNHQACLVMEQVSLP